MRKVLRLSSKSYILIIIWYRQIIILMSRKMFIVQIEKNRSKFNINDISDESALFNLYYINHINNINYIQIQKAPKVISIDQPNRLYLGYKEYFWINQLKCEINITQNPYSELN